jgi:hypothetical protein
VLWEDEKSCWCRLKESRLLSSSRDGWRERRSPANESKASISRCEKSIAYLGDDFGGSPQICTANIQHDPWYFHRVDKPHSPVTPSLSDNATSPSPTISPDWCPLHGDTRLLLPGRRNATHSAMSRQPEAVRRHHRRTGWTAYEET